MSLTTPAEALALILEAAEPLPVERVPLAEALGRAAAEDLVAAEPVPPFTNAAIESSATESISTPPELSSNVSNITVSNPIIATKAPTKITTPPI